jgi:hypothetical protein
MLQSHIVEIDGTFLGAAVEVPEGFKFVAVNRRLRELDGRVAPTLGDLRRIARAAFLSGRVLPQKPPVAALTGQMTGVFTG